MERLFKYHALGNDFVVLDRRVSGEDVGADQVRAWCDRRRGIGADGVLAVLPSTKAAARMVVHNADGSVAEMCGNGLRCVVKHVIDRGGGRPARLAIETGAGVLDCEVQYGADQRVSVVEVAMGPARLLAKNLPSGGTGQPFVGQRLVDEPSLVGTAVSMGNPHLVLFDRPLEEAGVLGPRLERAAGFPERTNVEWCRPAHGVAPGLEVVVWERGVGLTQACGTGACAAVAAAATLGRLPFERWVAVRLPGGVLDVWVAGDLAAVRMRGPVTFVFEATTE